MEMRGVGGNENCYVPGSLASHYMQSRYMPGSLASSDNQRVGKVSCISPAPPCPLQPTGAGEEKGRELNAALRGLGQADSVWPEHAEASGCRL